jgi:hypothetical protein
MISGAHVIVYSRDAEADRAFFRDHFKFPNVDVGGGWLIFGLPPSEVAFHPGDTGDTHELYLMCDDIEAFRSEMAAAGIACNEIEDQPYGRLVSITLPGGSPLGVYQPLHERPV